jgi:hypothetical protein
MGLARAAGVRGPRRLRPLLNVKALLEPETPVRAAASRLAGVTDAS